MKMINSLSRKLLWCLDFIPGWLKTIFNVHDDRWSEKLPDDVMQLILQRLHMSDYLSCRDVCRSWRAVIISKRRLPANDPTNQLPWLLLDSCYSYYIKDGCLVSDRKLYKSKKDCTIYWPGCVGSIEGWLIMSSKYESVYHFFLLNPVLGAQIMLPSHSAGKVYKIKAVASSIPTETRLQQPRRRCYVSCLFSCLDFEKRGHLAFCAPGDKSWTSIETKAAEWDDMALGFRDIEIVDGKLYAVFDIESLEFLMVFDIELDTNGCGIHTCTAQRLVTRHPNFESVVEDRVYHRICYLAKGSESNELFMILHKHHRYTTRGFQVLKLEYNVTTGPQWVEIVDLGDQVLFISGLNNKFISLGSTFHDETLEKNSIYFIFDSSETYECGVFSLTNRSIIPLNSPKDHEHMGIDRTVWFTPNSW